MDDKTVIDMNEAIISRRVYQNTSLKKEPLVWNHEYFLLKYPERNRHVTHTFQVSSYMNNAISEYVGCHIFDSVGIQTQQTFMAKRDGCMGVACKDFVEREKGYELQEFGDLANRYFSSSDLGRNPTLETIYYVYENHETLQEISEKAKERFWETFVIDALIGNPDRHIGNWGFLVNPNTKAVKLAPVYDCGSSLYAKIDDLRIRELLASPKDIEMLVHRVPQGKITYEGKKYDYSTAFMTPIHSDCQNALLSIFPKIDMKRIHTIIKDTPTITVERMELLTQITTNRYQQILQPAYEIAMKQQRETDKKQLNIDKTDGRKRTDFLSPVSIDTQGWKFDKEEANER
ncbi:MAG: HipA domain-containing protein [Lachnoclostridium sp.]|jgi:hypothetical protein|nr:HipA domain-containing protein [Lachnoclostridium sp.]